jgi:PAS domain S-box-containing protein
MSTGIHTRPGGDSVALVGGGIAGLLGVSALLGWWLGIDPLKSLVPGLLTMKVNTAIAVLLLGGALLLLADPISRARTRVGVAAALLAATLTALVGSQYVLGRSLGIDQWLFREAPGQIGTVDPNRMSPMTVVSLLAVSIAIALATSGRARRAVTPTAFVAVSFGLLNVLDALLDAQVPSILAGSTQMAVTTSFAVIALGFGVLGLLPDRGPLDVLAGDSSTARLARRLLAGSIAAPVLLAWLHVRAEEAGIIEPRYGTSLMVLGTFGFLAIVIWQATRTARKIELTREAALEERDRFFAVSRDLLVTANADGYFLRVNPAWERTLGYDLDTLTSRPFASFIHPDDLEATAREVDRQVKEGESVFNFQNRYRHRDGSYRWLEWTSAASDDGTLLHAVARDITKRKLEDEQLRAPALAQERRLAAARDRVLSILEEGAFAAVYQPIIDMELGTTVGFEALTRFADGWPPAEAFATATECGLGQTLERAAIAIATVGARGLPGRVWLSLNVSPSTLEDLDALRAALGLRTRPLVLEITEHQTIAAYGPVRDAVRAMGPDVRLAVDDAGVGAANFNHLVELRPQFVKIDASLVRGVDADLSRQALVAGILHFADTAGCEVIAEGIETDAERDMLERLGVRLGQGYLLGRPAPAEEWAASATGPASTVPTLRVTRPVRAKHARQTGRATTSTQSSR